jgi:hypothetical protein
MRKEAEATQAALALAEEQVKQSLNSALINRVSIKPQ